MRFATLALCCCAATATAAPRAHVSLTQTGDAPGLFDTTAELLRRIDVDVSGGEDAGVDDVAVRLDVQDTQTLVTLSRARDGVHGVRHVRRASTAEVHVEVVAHVVQAAVEALLAEEAPARVEQPLPAPPLVTAADEAVDAGAREGLSLALGGLVGGRMMSGETLPSLSVGLLSELRWRNGFVRPGAWLSLAYTLPVTVPGTNVGVRLHLASARLVPSFMVFETAKLALDVGLGGGVDVYFPQPTSSLLPERALRPTRPEAVPVLATMLTLQWHATQHLHVFISAGLDYDLLHKRFVADISGTREVVLDPWRFRPALLVGLTYDAVSGGKP